MPQHNLLEIMGQEKTVATVGFLTGFVNEIGFSGRSMRHPFRDILRGIFGGTINSIISSFVSYLMPSDFRFLVPTVLIMSCIRKFFSDGSDNTPYFEPLYF